MVAPLPTAPENQELSIRSLPWDITTSCFCYDMAKCNPKLTFVQELTFCHWGRKDCKKDGEDDEVAI